MADKKNRAERTRIRQTERSLNRLNNLFDDMMTRVSGSGNLREKERDSLVDEIDNIIEDELGGLTKLTGGYYSTFLTKLFNEQEGYVGNEKVKTLEDIFANESADIFTLFQERYRNRSLLYEDLRVICSQLHEMMEAINATRDAVVTSDDLSKNVSRTINVNRGNKTESEQNTVRNLVENMEEKYGLLAKIKDHIVPKTLQYGTYYVYTVPYAAMFQKYYNQKVNDMEKYGKPTTALENLTTTDIDAFRQNLNLKETDIPTNEVTSAFKGIMEHIEVCTDEETFIPMVENTHFGAFMEEKFRKQVKKIEKDQLKSGNRSTGADGTLDISGDGSEFSQIKECYIKLIDPTRMIPIKIMDEILGYYYIHHHDNTVSRTPFSNALKITSNQHHNAKDLETSFLSKITDRIVQAFDKRYLEENTEFKDLILNSLIFNDVYKKKITYQFIPKEYITEFNVNKDENGEGRSVLLPSLFYAKLYLSLLIFNMLTIVSRSNDTKIYYIKNSGIDTDVVNQVQKTAMDIKSRQINFNDLLNYNSMMGKIGHARDIFMPTGSSGERAIEFDILSGQQVEMDNFLMNMLRTGAINATGVPSVITEHQNEVDYARTLIMANAKFLGRAVSYQLEFNPSITELYRKLLHFGTTNDIEVDDISIVLSPPKALTATNMSDLISNTQQVVNYMVSAEMGENSSPSDDDNRLKDLIGRDLAKELLPMLPWNSLEDILKQARIEIEKHKAKNKENNETPADQQE